MKTWKLVLGVTLVFILGVLVGLLPSFYCRHNFPPFPPPPPMDHKERGAYMLERLSRDLDLTQDQRNRVKGILVQLGERLEKQFRETEPEVKKIFDESFSQVENLLDENQMKKFHALKERMERQRKERGPLPWAKEGLRSGPFPPPPPPGMDMPENPSD
jgi:hypothetical protein